LQVSVAYFPSEELWRLPRNNELRYRTRINSDFVCFRSEFFQRHSHVLAQVARVRIVLKRYVCLVSCTRDHSRIQLLISYKGARRMLRNFNALSTQKLHCIFTGDTTFQMKKPTLCRFALTSGFDFVYLIALTHTMIGNPTVSLFRFTHIWLLLKIVNNNSEWKIISLSIQKNSQKFTQKYLSKQNVNKNLKKFENKV